MNNWKNITDELPPLHEFVLVVEDLIGIVAIARRIGSKKPYWWAGRIDEPFQLGVTHWMPLPKPPSKKGI